MGRMGRANGLDVELSTADVFGCHSRHDFAYLIPILETEVSVN